MAGRSGRPGWLREPDPLQNPLGSRLAILGAIVLVIGGGAATLAGGADPASGLPTSTAGDSVSTANDSVSTAGDSVSTANDSVSTAGDSVSTAGDSVSTANDSAELASWYHGSEGLRARVATDVAAARAYLAAQDGASLQPVCVSLGTDTQAALTAPVPPTVAAQARFDAGGRDYAAAAASCKQLFDGTRIQVGVLQQRIAASLADGDREWGALAALIGQPMATASPPAASGRSG
ncbi:hypothetical protein CcI6DRAFT_01746 [Frankia sp. CcI6]|uniref:hypothetical protein n=1 Tax=unclassified Frankia TaxID=2632575 RepID=UPI0003CFF119|nr:MULTISPECIES: hypothetical protein [unclassified Frankia]ETA02786.1 hypothetical protein CcI6DRAFT_01746 [Frankia sp. CcI6]KFB06777.1 hypothetical protein ALLO2DRAFT_00063 [Frankia sp. Allo2]